MNNADNKEPIHTFTTKEYSDLCNRWYEMGYEQGKATGRLEGTVGMLESFNKVLTPHRLTCEEVEA